MDHEGMDLLRTPGSEGAVEKWEAYLATTKVSHLFSCTRNRGLNGRIRSVDEILLPSSYSSSLTSPRKMGRMNMNLHS